MKKTCYCCDGTGRSVCKMCNGSGRSVRLGMEYLPILSFAPTLACICENCGGHGRTTCEVCGGTGFLKDDD